MARKVDRLVKTKVRIDLVSEVEIELPSSLARNPMLTSDQYDDVIRRIGRSAILNGISNVVVNEIHVIRKLPAK